jgi:hypothetical protein
MAKRSDGSHDDSNAQDFADANELWMDRGEKAEKYLLSNIPTGGSIILPSAIISGIFYVSPTQLDEARMHLCIGQAIKEEWGLTLEE